MEIYDHLRIIFEGVVRPTVFECGAHTGTDTAAFLSIFNDPILHAFEPDRRNLEILKAKGFDRSTRLVPVAVGAQDGLTTLFASNGNPHPERLDYQGYNHTASSSIRPPKEIGAYPWLHFEASQTVRVVTLDTYCAANGIDAVDFIWADVQGAEGDLIVGGRETLSRTKYLFTEYSNVEVYEGEWNLERILAELPEWEVIERYEYDVFLRNKHVD